MSDSNKHDCSSNKEETSNDSRQFICGVVEGFYGKPWTFSQRQDLFKRLKEMNLNAFMYAPKDDTKHRAKWRQLYDETEARELRILINEAESNGIDFYYSLAPGLDMIYSCENDLNVLRRKFDQLRSLGCKSFAILFDDIEPRVINAKDKSIFGDNYAQAQVSVSNMIYEYLNRPKFLFCPTEYCESRAVPSVPESQYLNTIGSGLDLGIDFMWSGIRVISRYITEESIHQLSQVIRRPPVIWENLHANDYDKKRVYLGPYSGRSTKIIPKLRGVLTNPNCEYEANYIAIHTLAQWSRCTEDVNPLNRCNQDTQMETAVNMTPDGHCQQQQQQQQQQNNDNLVDHVYDPDRALVRALRDWLPHVLADRSPPGGNPGMTRDMRNDSVAESQITKEVGCEVQNEIGEKDIEVDMQDEQESTKLSPDNQSGDSNKTTSDMDTGGTSPPVQMQATTNTITSTGAQMVDGNSCDSCEMQDANAVSDNRQKLPLPPNTQPIVDCIVCSANNINNNHDLPAQSIDLDSLALMVDFFYLPFEHGLRGHALLSDIKWLIDNSDIFVVGDVSGERDTNDEIAMNDEGDDDATKQLKSDEKNQAQPTADPKLMELWLERAERMHNLCGCINRIISALIHDCPNKLITVELYPYLAELRDAIMLITDYIKFLRQRRSSMDRFYFSSGPKRRDQQAVICDDQEPWVHRGGLIGDMQRLIS